MRVGANYLGNGNCEFTVWAPTVREVAVKIVSPEERLIPMQKDELGYWKVSATDIAPGTHYMYRLDGEVDRPDPASHSQPKGVHEASEVVDHSTFSWSDSGWTNIPLDELIIYELHVGTFTPEGTFEAVIPRLRELKETGINAIEIMPVAQFPGDRNWGYDGVYPYGVQNSYGGPEGLKKLVDACHQEGMVAVLDVVYNHFGPEGNYIGNYAPYFTSKYHTPWGNALNFDDAYSDGVRNYFVGNVLYWLREYHIDALRLDAVHAIYDFSAKNILAEMTEKVAELSQQQGRKYYLIAESDLNDVRIIRPQQAGGYGLDAQWSDDFHHSLHTLLVMEQQGYYQDYGLCKDMEVALRESFVYSWRYSPFRQRFFGSYAGELPASQFVVCSQNHDQVGNRMLGERLTHLISYEGLKLAAGTVLLSPYIPMLFMGEEYGEEAPFLYFVSHSDPDLVKAVREGRKREFAAFHAQGEAPDADSVETFHRSKLNWEKRSQGKHGTLLKFYQELIGLRRQVPALKRLDRHNLEVTGVEEQKFIYMHRWTEGSQALCVMNFSVEAQTVNFVLPEGNWQKRLDSSDPQWGGNGPTLPEKLTRGENLTIQPQSFALYLA